jgi:hypothetical protein
MPYDLALMSGRVKRRTDPGRSSLAMDAPCATWRLEVLLLAT